MPDHAPTIEHFTRLWAECQRPVYLYAMSLLFNAADADEVLQETNMILWRKFDQYQPGTDFLSWAYAIAHYEVMKVRQQRARDRRLFSDDFLEVLAAPLQRSADHLETRRVALASCLGRLRDGDRELLLRRYQRGATTRDVAAAMGRSVGGTRKTLHRVRAALAACVRRTLARDGEP
jgi:RNA polymerase sigma-70 factor (ECF subfamily)